MPEDHTDKSATAQPLPDALNSGDPDASQVAAALADAPTLTFAECTLVTEAIQQLEDISNFGTDDATWAGLEGVGSIDAIEQVEETREAVAAAMAAGDCVPPPRVEGVAMSDAAPPPTGIDFGPPPKLAPRTGCWTCKHLVKETESWEMPHIVWYECAARPQNSNLRTFPFKNTKCVRLELRP